MLTISDDRLEENKQGIATIISRAAVSLLTASVLAAERDRSRQDRGQVQDGELVLTLPKTPETMQQQMCNEIKAQ